MQSTPPSPVRWTIYDLAMFEGDRAHRYEIIDGELFVNWQEQVVEVYRRENAVLTLVATLYRQDQLTSSTLPGFSCLVSQFF